MPHAYTLLVLPMIGWMKEGEEKSQWEFPRTISLTRARLHRGIH